MTESDGTRKQGDVPEHGPGPAGPAESGSREEPGTAAPATPGPEAQVEAPPGPAAAGAGETPAPGDAPADAGATQEPGAGGEAGAGTADRPPVRWYIVHTYSGHEARAKKNLLERAKAHNMAEFFDEVLIPEENVVEVVKGEKRTSKRKFFPGYILVRMNLTDETWHVVKDTPKVTGFVGGADRPTPLPDEEVAKMTQQIQEGASKPKPRIVFEEGENVRVISGPFANFSGFVDEVLPEKEKVRVMVEKA